MNRAIFSVIKTLLASCISFFVFPFSFNAMAQTLIAPAAWTGQGTSAAGPSAFTSLPASTVPGPAVVNVSQWNRDVSLSNTTAGGCYNSNGWTLGGSLATAIAANTDVYFTITNDAATELQITQIYVMSQVSSTGPQMVQMRYTVGSITNNFGPTIATAHTASPENWTINDNICIGAGQTATFRLYAWGGSNPAGTLRINNGTSLTAKFVGAITASPTNSSPVCVGGVVNFTGAFAGGVGPYTFSWSGPGSFSSTIQHPALSPVLATSGGTYTFVVTDALGCVPSSVSTTIVTVNPAPPAISGSLDVCLGSNSALGNAVPGGTWLSDNTLVAPVGLGTGVVTGGSLGTANITYTAPSGCYTTSVVTVNPLPSAITGTLSTCIGTLTALSDATPGGTWSSASGNVAVNPATGDVTGVAAGTAVVTYTLSTGCYATAVVTVTAFPPPITGPSTVCVNATINLSNASPGGTWSSGDVSIATVGPMSGVVTGQAQGTVNISYTVGVSCQTSATITVNPLPNAITGTAVVCENSTTVLSCTTSGGTWSSGNTFVATVGFSSGTVTGMNGGTVLITYRLISTGCFRTRTVTVNPLPANITGPGSVCLGSTVTLSSLTGSGTWTSNNSSIASITSSGGVVTGNTVGVTTITYTLSTGCFVTRTIVVDPLPAAIAGPSQVCSGGATITLTDASPGGNWTSSNPTIASVGFSTGVVTGNVSGVVTITYTLSTGCFATMLVTVNGIPGSSIVPLGDTMLCSGGFVVLTGVTGPGYVYQWYESGSPIPGATNATEMVTTAGIYQVEITNTLGCSLLSIPMTVSINPSTAFITPATSLTICSGGSAMLNANTGAGLSYQWMIGTPAMAVPGATASSYSATTAGNIKVVVTNTAGCSAEDSVTLNVNPLPSTATTASGPLVFCAGGNVIITSTSAPGNSYQWYNGGVPILGATNFSYMATATGSYYVMVTNSYGCNATSSATVVTENPLPDVTVSHLTPTVFCPGGSVTLNTITGVGLFYQWYNGGIPIPGATNYNYVASASGTFRVKIVNASNGCTAITGADTVVTVLSAASIVPLTSEEFCWGGESILSTTASSLPYVTFQWYLNGSPISGANGSTHVATVSGSYSCRIVPPGGCSVTTITLPVTEYPLPNPTISYNPASTLMSTQSYYVTYQWYKNLALIPGAITPYVYPTGNGDYKVQVTDTNGCQSFSSIYPLRNWKGPNTVQDVNANEIYIYPNPVVSRLHIDAKEAVHSIISSIDGKVLIETVASDIDVSNLAGGLYVVSIYDAENVKLATRRIVKVQ